MTPEAMSDELRDPTGEFGRVEATVALTKELDERLAEQYPLIVAGDSDTLEAYREGEITHASFKVDFSQRTFLSEILSTALERASNPDDPAYSIHGNEHQTFGESVETIVRSIKDQDYQLKFDLTPPRQIPTQTGTIAVRLERLLIESQPYNRVRYIPPPQALSESLSSQKNEQTTRRMIREAAVENGIPFAILAATYSGLTSDQLYDIFADKNFQFRLKEKFGEKVKIPTPKRNNNSDTRMLSQLRNTLTVAASSGTYPRYTYESYHRALTTLTEFGWIRPDDIHKPEYQMQSTTDDARARAVFVGMTEAAQRLASSDLRDPQRTNHIDMHYRGFATTQLITSFLVIDPSNP